MPKKKLAEVCSVLITEPLWNVVKPFSFFWKYRKIKDRFEKQSL